MLVFLILIRDRLEGLVAFGYFQFCLALIVNHQPNRSIVQGEGGFFHNLLGSLGLHCPAKADTILITCIAGEVIQAYLHGVLLALLALLTELLAFLEEGLQEVIAAD